MKNNSYACFFRILRHVPNLESHQIVLKTHCDSDQRVFNKPTVSQVAALWVEGEGAEQTYRGIFKCTLMVEKAVEFNTIMVVTILCSIHYYFP